MIPDGSAPGARWPGRGAVVVVAALGLALIVPGCSPGEPELATVSRALRDDPVGDERWRSALEIARQNEQLPALRAFAEELSRAHPQRWEPVWARARCLAEEEPEHRELLVEAHRLASATDDPHGIASCANDLGWADFLAGRLDEGRGWYERGLAAARAAERPDLEAFIRNNLAGLYLRTGEFARSREQLELAEAGLHDLGLEQAARWAALNRASIHLELGDATGARELLEQLHRQAVAAADTWTLDASAIILGSLDLAQGRPAEAHAWYEKVSRQIPELEDGVDFGLGRALLMEGRAAEAVRVLREAAERCRPRHAVRALNLESYAAHAAARSGDVEQARVELERIIETSDRLDAGESRWTARAFLGKLLIRLGEPGPAIPVLERAIDVLEQQSAPFDPMGEGLHFLRERTEPYVDLTLALARSGTAQESRILEIAGRVQARALSRLFDGDGGEDEPPGAALVTVQRALAADDLLLDYLVGEESGMLLAIRSDAVRAVPIRGRSALVEPLVRYREALSAPAADSPGGLDQAARRDGDLLLRELIGPVEDWMASAKRLYIVPDRELALLPFAALPLASRDGGAGFLGDVVETALLPRAGAPPAWDAAHSPVLLGGQPRLLPDSAFSELPWAAYELSRIRELWGEDRSAYLGLDDFSLEGLVASRLGRFRTIHLATHAEASTRDPRRCGVILSDGAKLGIAEIAGLELASSLVVLSACRTGEGELLPGQGVIGLGWAFLRAGARGIVVSQWTVDDVASARLMVAFHEHLRDGLDPVRALTLARRRLAAEHPHPRLWAPFVVVLRPGSSRAT